MNGTTVCVTHNTGPHFLSSGMRISGDLDVNASAPDTRISSVEGSGPKPSNTVEEASEASTWLPLSPPKWWVMTRTPPSAENLCSNVELGHAMNT